MENFCKSSYIDIKSIKWGTPPAPLFPRSLIAVWASYTLPTWVCADTRLPVGTTLAGLHSEIWTTMPKLNQRLRHFLFFLLKSHIQDIENIRCINRNWPPGLKVSDIGWKTRTRNCLRRQGLLKNEKRLANITFGKLFKIRGMGPLTVLDFSATLEGAMDAYDQFASVDNVTEQISLLNELAEEDWLRQISNQDPRFAPFLPSNEGTLQDRLDLLLSEPDALTDIVSNQFSPESINDIYSKFIEIQDKLLEDSLLDFLKLVLKTNEEKLDMLAARLGWNGKKPTTLQKSGDKIGLTRERVRQIQRRFLNHLPNHEVFMPMVDKALETLERCVPLTLDQASKTLLDAGISKTMFSPHSLLDAARLLGKKTSLNICKTRTGKMLVNDSHTQLVQMIPTMAYKLAGQSGATNVFQMRFALESKGHNIEESELRRLLHTNKKLDFLDSDWFWCPDVPIERNRLRNVTRRILSVNTPQSLQNIREGARRQYRYRATSHARYKTLTLPPIETIKTLFFRHPDFKVENNFVYSSTPLEYKTELGETERIMVEVLRSSPAGIMDRNSFEQGCVDHGMNENTFSVYSTYSCILEHVDIDIWKLRGVNVDPTTVEAVRIANHLKPHNKQVLQFGWDQNGKLWIATRLPHFGKNSLVIGCPSAVRRYLEKREFEYTPKGSEHHCGKIVFDQRGTSWGYGPYIRQNGLDENDILLAEFDLETNTAKLSVGDDELFDDIF